MNPEIWYHHALRNRLQSLLLLAVMGGFMALIGWLLWGGIGIIWLLFFCAILVLLNPAITPQLIMRMYRARQLGPAQVPQLYAALETLAQRADLPVTPLLFYVPSSMANSFATGSSSQAVIAITDGLLRSLNIREIVGVLAHEVGHIKNNDIRVMGIADLFSRMTNMLSLLGQMLLLFNLPLILISGTGINWFAILILIFAPNLSALAQLGLSRTREFEADLNAVRLTGDPDGLASALIKIEHQQNSPLEKFFLPGRRTPDPSLLRTHPPTEQRVQRLMELKQPPMEPPIIQLMQNESDGISLTGNRIRRKPRWHISGLWH